MPLLLTALLLSLIEATSAFTPTKDNNMNGEYILSNTPNQQYNNWSTQFKDYPNGGVEYFEFYTGPIKSTYSEVFWTPLPEVNLTDDIIKRFNNKAMAVVGIEADQVRRTKDGDISLPITVAYNHHYGFNLLGKGTRMKYVKTPPTGNDKITMHPSPRKGYSYVPVKEENFPSNSTPFPSSIVLGYSNGGEFRKTYHGLAPPFAQLIESPTHVSVVPMQIDTWNRDEMNLTNTKFVPGPTPKNSYAPTTGVDAIYSGLLECPLTTRIRKKYTGGGWNDSITLSLETCGIQNNGETGFSTSKECFHSIPMVQGINANKTKYQIVNESTTIPSGCTLAYNMETEESFVYYNEHINSTQSCGITSSTAATSMMGSTVTNNGSTSIHLAMKRETVTIKMIGPSDVWFGVGFDATSMSNSPYAIIISGHQGEVSEHVLGNHQAGTKINNSIHVISNNVLNGKRTIILSRKLSGLTPQHHTFVYNQTTINIISAYGSSDQLSYHQEKETSSLHMLPSNNDTFTCVCKLPAAPFGKGEGNLEYMPTGEIIGFPFRCNPTESVLKAHNPTCDIRTYVGGLSTCHHKWHLLDADQEIPWLDQPLEYWLKFRIYYQEYNPSVHIEAFDITWTIAGATGEYDVPKCAEGTPVEQCKHEVTGIIVPPGDDLHFVAAHYHW